jgi:hypothetical protein
VEQDFPVGMGDSDMLTEMAPRPNFYSLPRSGWNGLSRNPHPFTKSSGRQHHERFRWTSSMKALRRVWPSVSGQ